MQLKKNVQESRSNLFSVVSQIKHCVYGITEADDHLNLFDPTRGIVGLTGTVGCL